MPTRDTRDLTQQLKKLKDSLDVWRRQAQPPRSIPEEIWNQAVEAADEFGVGAVARHVGLDHAKLKNKLAQKEAVLVSSAPPGKNLAVTPSQADVRHQDVPASFLELLSPPSPIRSSERCVVEVESSRGSRMRLELSSLEAPGLVSLLREFVK